MKHLPRFFLCTIGCVLLVQASPTRAFIDELVQLKQELKLYDTAHAAEFDDVVGKLEGMAGPSFLDVAERDWFQPYVIAGAQWGLFGGYKDKKGVSTGYFGPGDPLTVAAALKISLEAAQIDLQQCPAFPAHAQAKTHWAATYVSCAELMQMRLFSGKKSVDLSRPVLRGEVVGLIHDAFGDKLLPLFSSFKDTANHPYEADIATAAARGFIGGDKDREGRTVGTFRPNAVLNRAEMAKVIYERLKVEVREEIAQK